MSADVPEWLPDWLQEALTKPTMSVPDVGRALYNAPRGQAYALARQGIMPTIKGGRRVEVPTIWVRRKLLIDGPPDRAA